MTCVADREPLRAIVAATIGSVVVVNLTDYAPSTDTDGPFDVSGATTLDLVVEYADGTTASFAMSFASIVNGGNGTGTDGVVQYVTTAVTDFPVRGDYRVTVRVVIPGLYDGATEIGVLPVLENLAA